MAEILNATCSNQVVKVGTTPVNCDILSQGDGASSGILILQGEQKKYVTSNAADLNATLVKLVDVLGTIADTLTAIGAGMLGSATAPPPTLAASVASIEAVRAELNTLKGVLK
jgi:hypothetical protein